MLTTQAEVTLEVDAATTGPWDLDARFEAPFAVLMAGELLGLSTHDTERINGFYSDFAGVMGYSGDPEHFADPL